MTNVSGADVTNGSDALSIFESFYIYPFHNRLRCMENPIKGIQKWLNSIFKYPFLTFFGFHVA